MTITSRLLEPPRNLHPQSRIMDSLVDNRDRIAAQERSTPMVRQTVSFAAGWGNYGGPFALCTYYMDRNRVYLEGLAICSGTSTLITTLPLGFRPTTGVLILSTQSSLSASLRIDIGTNGEMVVQQAVSSGNWVNFTDMNFRV